MSKWVLFFLLSGAAAWLRPVLGYGLFMLPQTPLYNVAAPFAHPLTGPVVLILAHQRYEISAGLLQSVSYGCPALVLDIGSVRVTVRRYSIGLTYRHLDLKHLRHQFDELPRHPTRYSDNALRFSRRVHDKAVLAALAEAFGAG